MAEPKEEAQEMTPQSVVEEAARTLPDRIEEQIDRVEAVAAGQTQAEVEAETRVRRILEQREQELERRRMEFELEQQRAEIERLKEQAAQAEAARAVPAAAVERTYIVQGGDTLSGIALTMYGDASRWAEIFEANRDQLNNPNLIYVGQTLRIP